jgi:hypothetical protein
MIPSIYLSCVSDLNAIFTLDSSAFSKSRESLLAEKTISKQKSSEIASVPTNDFRIISESPNVVVR